MFPELSGLKLNHKKSASSSRVSQKAPHQLKNILRRQPKFTWPYRSVFCGPWSSKIEMGMDQYLLIPFLGGWTSIYQLFWCSPGVQGFDTLPDLWPISLFEQPYYTPMAFPTIWWNTFWWGPHTHLKPLGWREAHSLPTIEINTWWSLYMLILYYMAMKCPEAI